MRDGPAVRLRARDEAEVVNVSTLGALLVSRARLLPGQRLVLDWKSASPPRSVSAQVRRSAALRVGESGLLYSAGVEFDEALAGLWVAETQPGN